MRTVSRFLNLGVFAGFLSVQGLLADDLPVMAPGVVLPPDQVSTNEAGRPVHHFSLRPVVTNVAAATNDLAVLRERRVKIEGEIKDILDRQKPLKPMMIEDYHIMTGFPTNYVPQDEEGRKIKVRITELEGELGRLRGQLEKRMLDDPAYKAAKSKTDAHTREWQDIGKRKDELRKEHDSVVGQIWQLEKLTSDAGQTNAVPEKKAGKGAVAP